jgi:hypothetical protein
MKTTSEGDFYVVPGFTGHVVEDGEQSSENDLLLLEMLALHYENYEVLVYQSLAFIHLRSP